MRWEVDIEQDWLFNFLYTPVCLLNGEFRDEHGIPI